MADINIKLPAKMVLTAGERTVRFTPYKENFVTAVPAGYQLGLVANTVGQYLYYAKQGFVDGEATGEKKIVINVPAKITIKNSLNKVMNFIPYKENFQQELEAGQACIFEAKTAGQVLYYLSQDTNGDDEGGLDVKQEAIAADEATSDVVEGE